MPMSPRLLRPRATGSVVVATDADARAYVLAVNAADGQPLEAAVQLAINDFVVGCKADGIWSAIKASCLLMGARTLSGALTPLVGSAPTNNGPFVSADYDRKTGLIGNGTSKYLASGRANNADPQNNRHIAVWLSSSNTAATGGGGGFAGSGSYIGTPAEAGGSWLFHGFTSVGAITLRQSQDGSVSLGSGSGNRSITGLFGVRRASSSEITYFLDGVATTTASGSSAPSSSMLDVFRGQTTNFSDGRIAFYSIGESLTLSTLSSRVSTLYNAIGAAIP